MTERRYEVLECWESPAGRAGLFAVRKTGCERGHTAELPCGYDSVGLMKAASCPVFGDGWERNEDQRAGISGSGKSTLAGALGRRYGVPVLHLDRVQFAPGWVERPLDAKVADVQRFLDGHGDGGWVIDGNYAALLQERRLEESDRIVILAFGRWTCLRRVLARYLRYHGRARESMAEGCDEKIDLEFIWWVLHEGRSRSHREALRAIRDRWPDRTVIIRNQRQLDAFYRPMA